MIESYILGVAVSLAAIAAPSLATPVAVLPDVQNEWVVRQEEVHDAAELLRELGVEEGDASLTVLSDEWWRCEVRQHPYFTDEDVVRLAKLMYGEAGGVKSQTEVACVGWTVCNHVDDPSLPNSVTKAMTAPGHFYYKDNFPVRDDLLWLARDVLERWNMEKLGRADVGRVLPADYLWYSGDGQHNYFRNAYRGGTRWNYSLPSPYDS